MSDTTLVSSPAQANYGWRVTLAGLGINLALGVLYSWSIISKSVPDAWQWSQWDKYLPYAVACLVFCLVMVPAGRMQDALGPRLVATIGGVFVGLGFLIASLTPSVWGYVIGFGLFAGSGFAFGYASATPPAVKWFPPAKTGMIAGIVVSGFGLASVYIAPLSYWLIGEYGLSSAIQILGVAFLVIVIALAQLLRAPSLGYVPAGMPSKPAGEKSQKKEDFRPSEIIATWQFYLLWFLYACGAGAGLMIIGAHAKIISGDYVARYVALLAIGNGGGRIVAGMLSDAIGRKPTLILFFLSQAAALGLLSQAVEGSWLYTAPVLGVLSVVIGASYGANLALFPSITKDFYGLKYFGTNYGLVFTAWGVGGFVLSIVAGRVFDATKSFNFAYYTSAALLLVAAAATLLLVRPHHTVEHETAA